MQKLSSQMQKKKSKEQQQREELIGWRRGQVIQLLSKGKNLSQTAEILKVDVSTVCRDYQYIRENADKVLKRYLAETVPLEVTKCLSRLNAISNEAWKMAEQPDATGKTKISALSLAQEAALHIVNVVTNNKPLIDEAFRFAEEESEGGEACNYQSQRVTPEAQEEDCLNRGEGDEREVEEEDCDNELFNKVTRTKEKDSIPADTVF